MCVATPAVVRAPEDDDCLGAPCGPRATPANLDPNAALQNARALWNDGHHGEALLHLRVLETAMPRIADHVAMLRGALREDAGEHGPAALAFREASQRSISAEVRATARLGEVRNLLYAKSPEAEAALWALLRRYPDLPEEPQLKLELAALRESQEKMRGAIAIYRSLDLQRPGYPVAGEARAHLTALREQGHFIPPYSPTQRVERAERLVRSGPVPLAREAVDQLSQATLNPELSARVAAIAADMARVEGRFKDARKLSREAKQAPGTPLVLADQEAARRRIKGMLHGRKLRLVLPVHLVNVLEVASRAQLQQTVDDVLLELARRASQPPQRRAVRVSPKVRFEALYKSAGVGGLEATVALADTLLKNRTYGVAARYHRARAMERAGQTLDAISELGQVVEQDSSFTRFYAQFADQRLRAIEAENRSDPCEGGAPLLRCVPAGHLTDGAPSVGMGPDVASALSQLEPIATKFGEAYPWLPRAVDLLYLGMAAEASDELHEAYLAWRGAVRRPSLRAGKESVYRGEAVGKPPRDWKIRGARTKLKTSYRQDLARVAGALGDWGTAAFFGGRKWSEAQPRAFESEVLRAATHHGVDPDLLWAVMRVESVYQRRIVSYAGAVGLMQIMPRTGRLIADQLGQRDATTTDLLNPATNVDYAAWYLRSLLDRMGGRLPLAIASYNGGPHNVRKWIHRYGSHLPLDAFLEHIPFKQTRRYVRRVLGYYAKYKALRGQKLAVLNLELPDAKPDRLAF